MRWRSILLGKSRAKILTGWSLRFLRHSSLQSCLLMFSVPGVSNVWLLQRVGIESEFFRITQAPEISSQHEKSARKHGNPVVLIRRQGHRERGERTGFSASVHAGRVYAASLSFTSFIQQLQRACERQWDSKAEVRTQEEAMAIGH